jgi:hypothetical protein
VEERARATRGRFEGLVGENGGRWGGAPAASGSVRRGPCCSAGGARRSGQGRGREGEMELHARKRVDRPLYAGVRAGQQRADRRSPGCAVRGTVFAGQLSCGTTPDGSGRARPWAAGSWGAGPRAGRSPSGRGPAAVRRGSPMRACAARRGLARGSARGCPRRVGVAVFDCVFPKIFEYKCTMWSTGKL